MDLFKELSGVERMLNFHVQRHGVLASNLANAETPGYQAKDLHFSGALAAASGSLATTNSGHIALKGAAASGGQVHEVEQAPSVDGNGVQKDHVFAQATANRVRYEMGLDLVRRRLSILRQAASDGGS